LFLDRLPQTNTDARNAVAIAAVAEDGDEDME
jgi:hypothetical protein